MLWLIGVAVICIQAAQTQTLSLRTVTTGLHVPWEVLWGPDGWLWVTERNGRISRIHPETGQQQVLTMLADVYESGESGLLGMAIHPNFADSPHVFVAYTYRQGSQIRERIVRLTYAAGALSDMRILLDGIPGNTIHDGCRLLILPDRTLLVTTGDAANSALSQQLSSLAGKVLRLRLDGTIPDDNPVPDSPVWSLGHRNAQGLCSYEGIVYSSEHGPNTDDEVNIIERGRNYGWPSVNGFCDRPAEMDFCAANNVVEPLAAWTPTLAVCGMEYYASDRIPQWQHSLLLATLKASQLVVLKLDSTRRRVVQQQSYLQNQLGRLRDVCVSPDGRVFVATSNTDSRGSPRTGDDRIVELIATTSTVSDQPSLAWHLAPHPLRTFAQLHIAVPEATTVTLELSALTGSTVQRWQWENIASGIHTLPLDTSAVAPGVYVARLHSGRFSDRTLVVIYP